MKLNFTSIKRSLLSLLLLLICQIFNAALAQNERKITGTVYEAENIPAIGITVAVKGAKNAVVTNTEGSFSINAKNGDILVFSSIGYDPKEVKVTDQSSYKVMLSQAVTTLGDVVVVGYGKQDRKNVTSSITSVKADDLNRGAISDPAQLLQGKVAGLTITRSGDPNQGAAIVLRGASTLRNGAQSPFFVVDGVPGADLSIVAPDDIVSMEVLKDAAATAIYGNRAANGVIMVTTKRAKSGQLQLSYNGYLALENVSNQYDMMDASQLKDFLTKNNLSLTPKNDQGANTDWQSAVQRRQAMSKNHNLSLGGGTDKTLYSASLNYFDQEGILKTSALNRLIARLSIEQKAFDDKLKLGLSVSNSISNADYVPYRNTVLSQMLTYLPTAPIRNADGSYYENADQTSYYNPVSMIENAKEQNQFKNMVGSFNAQLKLPLNFTYDVNLSYQNQQSTYGAYYNSYYTANYNNVRSTPEPGSSPVFVTLTGKNGQAIRNAYQNTTKLLETFVTWDKKLANHSITAVLGYSFQETLNGDGFQTSSTNFPVDDVGYNNLSLGDPRSVSGFAVDYGPSDIYQKTQLISDFGRLNYGFKDKYLVQASLRRDGASVFGKNYQWGYFPSVSVGWRITQEGFMENQQLFNDLKLRASYGVTGNSAGIRALTSKLVYGNVGTFYYNGGNISALGATQNENPNLRWEKTATSNAGLDFSILKGKVSGSIDVYDKKTTDLIWDYEVSTLQYPYRLLTANVGAMSNKGIEFAANAKPVTTKNFNWTTSFNIAHNKNKLTSLSNDTFKKDTVFYVEPDGGGQSGSKLMILVAGSPIGQFFTLDYAGKNANNISQYRRKDGTLTTTPTASDRIKAGNAQPKLLLGWANTFKYKNVDLNIFLRSSLGSKIFNATLADLYRPKTAVSANIPVEVASESVDDQPYRYSNRFIESGDYLRVDNFTLGYNFKKLNKNVQNLRVYLSGNNVYTLTKYKGIDPEINQGGLAPGVDSNNFYPKTRTFLFGANVSF